jgi:hypothetical protein
MKPLTKGRLRKPCADAPRNRAGILEIGGLQIPLFDFCNKIRTLAHVNTGKDQHNE